MMQSSLAILPKERLETMAPLPTTNIIVIQLKRMGDLVQTLPLLRRLREEYPGGRITFVCLEEFQGILAAWPCYDRLISIRIPELFSMAGAADTRGRRPATLRFDPFLKFQELREEYDFVINLSTHPGSATLAAGIKSARKVGCAQTAAGIARRLGRWSKYAQARMNHRKETLWNEVDVQLGIAGMTPRALPEPTLAAGSLGDAHDLLRAHGSRGTGKLVALLINASKFDKTWPLERFAEVGRELLCDGDVEILLVGNGKERGSTDRFLDLLMQDSIGHGVIDLVGKTRLDQLPALLTCCDLVVGNDTGPLHVAAAAGTPTLGLFFSTAFYAETGPYGEGHAALQVEIPCAPCHPSSACANPICKGYLDGTSVHAAIRWMLAPGSPVPYMLPRVSLYRSRFLANGTLAYLPVVPAGASAPFLQGLMGRLLWDGAMGISFDRELAVLWFSQRDKIDWAAECRKVTEMLRDLEDLIREGLLAAVRLGKEYARPHFAPAAIDAITRLETRLADTTNGLAARGAANGLWGKYLLLELSDMDFQPYPAMAYVMEAKYRSLLAWHDGLRRGLEFLAS